MGKAIYEVCRKDLLPTGSDVPEAKTREFYYGFRFLNKSKREIYDIINGLLLKGKGK